jgi:hypothetical protein
MKGNMLFNPLKPAKSPSALTMGAILISLYVLVCNIPLCSANAPVFSMQFKKKSLPEAMETLASMTQTKITLIGEIESTALNSMQIESRSLSEMIKTILKRYGVENYAIIYEDGAKVIKIRLLASSSAKAHHFVPAPGLDQHIVDGQLTPTRMFSAEDFARLLEKDRAIPAEREFTQADFARLLKRNVSIPQFREFSAADFAQLTSRKTKIKEHPTFSSDDFARVLKNSDSKDEDKLFSAEDFANVLKNQK